MRDSILSIHEGRGTSRRDFLRLMAVSGVGLLAGCAVNPVTGRQQLMLVSEDQEISMDRENAPHQFSSDYGTIQDSALNDYVNRTGRRIAANTHRAHMPYSFRVVNANYVNAYAFPGGSIACTRGILLSMENEAELAALLGHELGHVNARHTAGQMSKGMLTQTFVGGLSAILGTQGAALGNLTSQLGMIGVGALLASYSRDNEREADALGMEYMVRAGYTPGGMVGLHEMLRGLSKHNPSAIELMFATHPMSEERYQTAVANAQSKYASSANLPEHRERYMDNTARLRTLKGAVEEMEKGERLMSKEQFGDAERHFQNALRMAPNDYPCLLLLAKCKLIQKDYRQGIAYAERAQKAYPEEAQAYHLSGYGKLMSNDFTGAHRDFDTYEKRLPGNANIIFFKGYTQEKMQHKQEAAREFQRYLQMVQQGDKAQYAYARLKEWGYYK